MKNIFYVVLCGSLLTMTACNDVGFKKTKSGLMYKILSDKNNPPSKKGDWLKIHIRQTVHDSLLGESYKQMPIYIQSDSFPAQYDPREVLPMLRKGDSAVVVMFGDSIFRRQGGLPEFMKKEDKIIFTFKVLDLFTSDTAKINDETAEGNKFQKKQEAEMAVKKDSTIKEMEKYFADNNITYQKAPGGTYVVITEPGTGPKCDTGKTAYVLYKGVLFKGTKVFDQNMDGSRPPYPVKVGNDNVISGWHEGLPYFAKGGKGKLYVPFFTGYGPQPGPDNTPYANMVFDIEIADVKDASATPPPPPPTQIPNQ
jgi:FKBP-type peptidyl-prolyl cis-trans isomerase FkpA